MDANGTRFHLLLGDGDWSRVEPKSAAPASVDPDRSELMLERQLFRFPSAPADRKPALADRRGVARDRFGNVYFVDTASTAILVQSVGSGVASHFWSSLDDDSCAEPPWPGEFGPLPEQPKPPRRAVVLGGLAVTSDHYLVAGTLDPAGLLVFDLRGGGPPQQALWPAGVRFRPSDLATRTNGGVFILDVFPNVHARYWELDRRLFVVSLRSRPAEPDPVGFEPVSGSAPRPSIGPRLYARVVDEDAAPVDGEPVAIDAGADGTVLVLDRNGGVAPSLVRRYRGPTAAGTAALASDRYGVSVVAHDMALVPASSERGLPSGSPPGEPERTLGLLHVADAEGNQSYAFLLTATETGLAASLEPSYYPLRLFAGKGLVAGADTAAYDFGDRWLGIVEQRRPRYAQWATVATPIFDGGEPGCVWHRLLVDACIPPEGRVEIASRASDDARALSGLAWVAEPPLYRRGESEQPFLDRRRDDPYATWELLFQRARGRHLQLRLRLVGDGRSSPRLRALRVYYPRFSYLESYLPKVYREDDESASFLDRFLANLEGINTAIEDRVVAVHALFDPRSAPADALDWLARWFDVALDPTWSEARRRIFIRHAMEFFRWRGTMRGLDLALRLALDRCAGDEIFDDEPRREVARIVERFRTRLAPPVVAGDPTSNADPRVLPVRAGWRPGDGGEVLSQRYREFLARTGATLDPELEFPLRPPSGLTDAWRAFARATLGFEPAAPGADVAWREFLTARYRSVGALDAAYGLVGAAGNESFEDVAAPTELPPDGLPIRDWHQFETIVLPTRAAAHRFTVLLPVQVGEDVDRDALTEDERRELASRIVDLQKPAHTVFDVRFFWSAFRIGEARLELDTAVDLGSRSPRLLTAATLGRSHVGETRLAGDAAPRLTDPPSIFRDRLVP